MTHALHTHYDVIIAGGGMVGASFALSLAHFGKKVLVVEKTEFQSQSQQSFDERTVALTYSSRIIFEQLGIWSALKEAGVTAIKDIHISDRGHIGMTHLHADMVGTSALGYVVPTRHIGKALWQQLSAHESIDIACPARIVHAIEHDDKVTIDIAFDKSDNTISTSGTLFALADGGRSSLAEQMGFSATEKHYGSNAIVCFIEANKAHNGRAYERFTEEGPIALLPHLKNQYACVWTSNDAHTQTRMALNEKDFLHELQQQFGFRAGRFVRATARQSYPLTLTEMSAMTLRHSVLIGNAAHKVHPVAGQGFNLGLRDVALLTHLLELHWQQQKPATMQEVIQEYAKSRHAEAKRVKWFTDGLIELFTHQWLPVIFFRGVLLKSIEVMPFIKRALLKRTMGLSAKNRILYADKR